MRWNYVRSHATYRNQINKLKIFVSIMTFSIRQCLPCLTTPEPTNHNVSQPRSTPNPPEEGSSRQIESVSSEPRTSPRTGGARQKELLAQVQANSPGTSNAQNLGERPYVFNQRYAALKAKQKELWEEINHVNSVQHHLGMDYAAQRQVIISRLSKEARQLEYEAVNETFYERLTACLNEMGLKDIDEAERNLAPEVLGDIKLTIKRGITEDGWVGSQWKPDPNWKPQSDPSQSDPSQSDPSQ